MPHDGGHRDVQDLGHDDDEGRAVRREADPLLPAPRPVLVIHDEGRWYAATLLDAYRSSTGWRAVVRYSVEPGCSTCAACLTTT